MRISRFAKLVVITLVLFLICMTVTPSGPTFATGINPIDATRFVQVEGGNYYSIALRKDGSVWTWGRNMLGEIGIQDTVTFASTDGPVRLSSLTDIKQIATSGDGYNLAIKADGTVWTWGSTTERNNGDMQSILPYPIKGITDAIAVAATSQSGTILRKDGTLWTWDRSTDKQSTHKTQKLTIVKGLAKVTQLAVTSDTIYAVLLDGTVMRSNQSATKPLQLTGLSSIRSVVTGNGVLYALDKKNKVWRLDSKGKPAAVQPQLNVKDVRAAGAYTLFLTTDGEVFSYGATVTGKQGKVKGLPKITAIGAGIYHNQAISENGEVWGWGGNHFNAIGASTANPDCMVYSPILANAAIDLYVDGKLVPSIVAPRVTSKTVLVPITTVVRFINASFGRSTRHQDIPDYSIHYKDNSVTFRLNQSEISVNETTTELPEPISYLTGALSAPYELFQALDFDTSWNPETKQLHINTR